MNKTLLILAAGMGSRFGGLKQIEPVGPNGEFIVDYSIYDALRCGFNKVVFIIKEENYEIFRDTIGKRIESKVKVEYVFQKLDNLPAGYTVPKERIKPLGTAHAVLCARNIIHEPFAIINADDFYGYDAFKLMSKAMDDSKVALLVNKLVLTGTLNRGICFTNNDKLEKIVESRVERIGNDIVCTPLNGKVPFVISEDTNVSMNMITFPPTIFDYIEKKYYEFLEKNKNDMLKCEFFIPDILTSAIKENYCDVYVVNTASNWVGITHKEDKSSVISYIENMIKNNEYKNNLWD